jgi:hypothetical protein
LLCLALLPDVAIWEQRDAVVKEAIGHTFVGQLVRNRTDVAWLERVVRGPDNVSEVQFMRQRNVSVNTVATAAFARLGELATPASLAAVRRIEEDFARATNLTPATVTLGRWEHPAWHMSTGPVKPLVEVDTPVGWVALVPGGLLGGQDLYLMRDVREGRHVDTSTSHASLVGLGERASVTQGCW